MSNDYLIPQHDQPYDDQDGKPYPTPESCWWGLTDFQRVYFERCVQHIVYTHGRAYTSWLIGYAQSNGLTVSPLVNAVVWRLCEELSYD